MPTKKSEAKVAGVRLTSPDKVLYAEQGISKRDLADYYEAVAPVMLPEIEKRLVSFVRCPDGRSGQCFFQRHISRGMPASFRQMEVRASNTSREKYIHLAGVQGLVGAAQFGVLEIHIWGSHVDDVERPDRIVFDLDPGEGVGFDVIKRAAEEMRTALESVELASVPMLTGGKGIHVIAPIVRQHGWAVVKAFCRALAEQVAAGAPDRFVTNMAKAERRGRIFIDYLRNDRTSTAIAPFSPRARAGAPLAWPVDWDALAEAEASAEVMLRDVLSGDREPATWAHYPARGRLKAAALRSLGVDPDQG